MNVTINVTQDDIDQGEPRQRCACPVWLAIHRAAPSLDRLVVIYLYAACWDSAGKSRVIHLPGTAANFITFFDAGLPVEPFSFDLEIADDLLAGAS